MTQPANPHCVAIDVEYFGQPCILGIASTTHQDLHGTRMAKELMFDFKDKIAEKYIKHQINHQDNGPQLGVLVSAKVFELPDGETAIGVLVLKYTDEDSIKNFPIGAPNTVFDYFQPAVDIKALLIMHAVQMATYVKQILPLEDQLDAFFESHIIGSDGQVRVNKNLVTKIKSFRVEIHPEDHPPAHFHLISVPRGINVRFTIDPLERLKHKMDNISKKDEKLVKLFFQTHPDELAHLKDEAKRLKLQN